MLEVIGEPAQPSDTARVIPSDPSTAISSAITSIEHAAARANEFGRFWMKNGDQAHGRRWFARERRYRQLVAELRFEQWYALNPPTVDTPTAPREGIDDGNG